MPHMAGESGSRRATSLKTYSRRVNRGFPPSTAKKTSERGLTTQESSAENLQRRVLKRGDEIHSQEDNPQLLPREPPLPPQQQHDYALNTESKPRRQALLEINANQSYRNNPGYSKKGDSTALQVSQRPALHSFSSKHVNRRVSGHPSETTDINNDHHSVSGCLPSSDKDIVPGDFEPSPSKTGRNQEAPEPEPSITTSRQGPTTKSVRPHLDKPSKRRRQPDDPDSELPSGAKKVKRSSITNYFKPLPSSSSPLSTRSVTVFSDSLEKPSSPPTSPLSSPESPKFRKSRKKSRRNLSIKPSLPAVTMSYDEEHDAEHNMSFAEVVGNMDDGSRIERAERWQDHWDRQDLELSRREDRRRGATSEHVNPDNRGLSSQPMTNTSQGTSAPTTDDGNRDALRTPSQVDRLVLHSKPIDITAAKPRGAKKTKYIQQQFATSNSVHVQCPTCGFTYNVTNEEDVRKHKRWHRDHNGGNHPLRSFGPQVLWKENIDDAHRIVVGRARTMKERLWFNQALVISKRSLDGPLPEDIWEEIPNPSHPESGVKVPRYKVYVYTIADDVVSVILAERITHAGAYYCGPQTHTRYGKLATPDPNVTQEYVDLDRLYPVMVSVDRIWTDAQHQRNGLATKLLNYVCEDFILGMTLDPSQVAFSSPTSAGVKFAMRYCATAFQDCPFVIGIDEARMVIKNGKYVDNWAPSPEMDEGTTLVDCFN